MLRGQGVKREIIHLTKVSRAPRQAQNPFHTQGPSLFLIFALQNSDLQQHEFSKEQQYLRLGRFWYRPYYLLAHFRGDGQLLGLWEFIAVAYKLEVSHPPGAPLFMLLGRMFSFLAMGDVTKVSYWINFLSVLGSAFTILFLFWSITLFGRKMMGAKMIATSPTRKSGPSWAPARWALAYTFSGFVLVLAVEAEVYAMSSFFTAFVVWGVLKWDVIKTMPPPIVG